MRRIVRALALLSLAACTAVNRPNQFGGTAHDDSDTANPFPEAGADFHTQLNTFLGSEDANRYAEQGFANCVVSGCLGTTGASLTMTPSSCKAYNAGFRSIDTCSITFTKSPATIWVAMDENTNGSNSNLPPTFARVMGTHYLIDQSQIFPPSSSPPMASDSQLLTLVTTSGGAITAVTDKRNFHSVGSAQLPSPLNVTINGQVNSVVNVAAAPYNAVSSTTTETVSTNSGSANVTASAIGDFAVGQNIVLRNASANPPINGTPANLAISFFTYTSAGIYTQPGCTVDVTNPTDCTDTWKVEVCAVDPEGGVPPCATATSGAAGPNNASPSNRVTAKWSPNVNKGSTAYTDIAYWVGFSHCTGSGCMPATPTNCPIQTAILPNIYNGETIFQPATFANRASCATVPCRQYLQDAKSVADGVPMDSACVAGGAGSWAVAHSTGTNWLCGQ